MQAVATAMRRVGGATRAMEACAMAMPPAADRAASRLALFQRHLSASSSASSSGSPATNSPTSSPPSTNSPTSSPPSSVSSSQGRRFRFDVQAGFLGKGESDSNYRYKLPAKGKIAAWVAANMKKHGRFTVTYSSSAAETSSDKEAKKQKKPADAGDDFFFLSSTDTSGECVICGVADGVGGWSESGIDPSAFSKALCYYANVQAQKALLHASDEDPEAGDWTTADPRFPHTILQNAFDDVQADNDVKAGSSTACIVALDGTSGTLRAANLGDSGFLLHRDGKVVHQQPSQTHYFNCPYQLSKLPPGKEYNTSVTDLPSSADLFTCSLQDQDLVILFTDGFSDNVFPSELIEIIKRVERAETSPDKQILRLTDTLVSYARLCGEKHDKQSPFEAEAKRNGLHYKGGKLDDVMVIVARVFEDNSNDSGSHKA